MAAQEEWSTKLSQCVYRLWEEDHESAIDFLINGSLLKASQSFQQLFKELEAVNADFSSLMTAQMKAAFVSILDKNRPNFPESSKTIDAVATEMATKFPTHAFGLILELSGEHHDSQAVNEEEYEHLKKQLESEALKKADGNIDMAKFYMNVHVSLIFELYASPELSVLIGVDEADEGAGEGKEDVDEDEEKDETDEVEEETEDKVEAEGTEKEMGGEEVIIVERDPEPMDFTMKEMRIIKKALKSIRRSMRRAATRGASSKHAKKQ